MKFIPFLKTAGLGALPVAGIMNCVTGAPAATAPRSPAPAGRSPTLATASADPASRKNQPALGCATAAPVSHNA